MSLISPLFKTIIDALFPLSKVEEELLSYTPEEAYGKLSKAPKSPVENTGAVFAYKDERTAKLVWNIKYKKSNHAVKLGGYGLFQVLSEMNTSHGSVIIPMPITKRRRKERGFNQCELLLEEIKELDTENKFTYESGLLVRTHHSSRQTLKGRADRLESAKGIFAVQEEVAGQLKTRADFETIQIIVIDDVITTGSTIKEAMDTLTTAGFPNVTGLSIAH